MQGRRRNGPEPAHYRIRSRRAAPNEVQYALPGADLLRARALRLFGGEDDHDAGNRGTVGYRAHRVFQDAATTQMEELLGNRSAEAHRGTGADDDADEIRVLTGGHAPPLPTGPG